MPKLYPLPVGLTKAGLKDSARRTGRLERLNTGETPAEDLVLWNSFFERGKKLFTIEELSIAFAYGINSGDPALYDPESFSPVEVRSACIADWKGMTLLEWEQNLKIDPSTPAPDVSQTAWYQNRYAQQNYNATMADRRDNLYT